MGSGGSKDDRDPHSWDDPDTRLRDRFLPTDPKSRMMTYSAAIALLGLIIFFSRFIPSQPRDLLLIILIAGYPITYYKGHKRGFSRIREFDWNILFDGSKPVIRPGRAYAAEDDVEYASDYSDDGTIFEPLKTLKHGGMSAEFVTLRDEFDSPEQLQNKTGQDGDDPVRDYLPESITGTSHTDTLGTVYATFSPGLNRSTSANHERRATIPSTIPDRIAADLKGYLEELVEVQLPALDRKYSMQKRRSEELSRPADDRVEQILSNVIELSERSDGRRRRNSSSGRRRRDNPEDYGDTAATVDESVLDEIDDRVDEAMED